MIAALLLATSIASAVDAEHAFAADAQRIGQWAAFSKYADHDAVMFTPQATWARDFLKNRKEPAQAVRWWPTHSFVSCDGRTAVNTGPWISGSSQTYGYFTTVWQRTTGEWRWVYDGGDSTKAAPGKPVAARVHRASCNGTAPGAPVSAPPKLTAKQARTTPDDSGRGHSADKTLGWDWKVEADGSRRFRTFLWNGDHYQQVVYNQIAAQR